MNYYIYQITNNVNGKIYIGKHKTKDLNDNYFGSGKLLKRAITKYGPENFTKEILFEFDSEQELNDKEKELVTEEFCLRDDTYNLCVGGQGGFSYINREGINNKGKTLETYRPASSRRIGTKNPILSDILKAHHAAGNLKYDNFKGKTHTPEWRESHSKLMRQRAKGAGNSQFGTMWITDGASNRKIKTDTSIPDGWNRGRSVN